MNKRSGGIREVTTVTLRRHLGEVLDTAYNTGAEVRVNRSGKCLGVFVPIGLYKKRQDGHREAFLRFMEGQRATGRSEGFTDEEVMKDAIAAKQDSD
jgi:prevent-host-death family protein